MKMQTLASLPISALLLAFSTASVQAATLIYEPFADSEASLPGNTSGLGLDGNWSGSTDIGVTTGSMSWGSLETSGNQTTRSELLTRARGAGVSTGTTLSGGGHLGDTAELWFSFLAQSVPGGRSYVTLGTGAPDGVDRIGGASGFGLGVRLENGLVYAHGWDGGTAVKPTGTSVSDGTVFVVGKITWAAIGNDDKLEVFLPGTDLAQPLSVASTLNRDFDQSGFTTLGIGAGNTGGGKVDEIRFGTSYADVTPVPEPAAMMLIGLAGFAVLRRRRS